MIIPFEVLQGRCNSKDWRKIKTGTIYICSDIESASDICSEICCPFLAELREKIVDTHEK
jgi:hypothetical protein